MGFQLFKKNALVGGVLVNEKSIVSLLHNNIGVVKLAHHPPRNLGGHGQLGLLHFFRLFFFGGSGEYRRNFFHFGWGLARLNLRKHHELPQGHIDGTLNFCRRCCRRSLLRLGRIF